MPLTSVSAFLQKNLSRRHLRLSPGCNRFELVDSAVGHQRQEEMTIQDEVGSNVAPLPHDLIVQGTSGHFARVSASGPNSIWFGPLDFQVPRPRLQSIRAVSRPPAPNSIVYSVRSSGVSVVPSLP